MFNSTHYQLWTLVLAGQHLLFRIFNWQDEELVAKKKLLEIGKKLLKEINDKTVKLIN